MPQENPPTHTDENGRTSRSVARFLPLAVLVAASVLGFVLLRDSLSFDALRENRAAILAFRDAHPLAMPVLFVLAYVAVTALSLPGALAMTLTGGFLFGLFPGAIYNVAGATIGATVLFAVVRAGLADGLRARVERSGGAAQSLMSGLREAEVSVLLGMRLVPVVPFFIANLVAALMGVALTRFVWTTALGILPGGLVYTWVGAGLGAVFERGEAPDLGLVFEPAILGPLLGLAALSLSPGIVKLWRRA